MARDLDDIDIGILKHLQINSNIGHKELGAIFNRSSSAISDRIKDLENKGYILGYKAVLNYEKMNNFFISYTIIQLKEHSNEELTNFEQEMALSDEVLECTHITGNFDFLIKVVVTNMRNYSDFVRAKLTSLPNVGKVLTSTVISEKKRILEYPLE